MSAGHLAEMPPEWRRRPLRSMFRRRKDVGHPDEPLLSVFREYGVVPRGVFEDHNQAAENRNIYQLVDDGWLVVNRMKAWQGSIGISTLRGIVSGHYICFEPTHQEHSRYLDWLLRSPVYVALFQTLSRGVRPGQAEIDNDDLSQIPIALPPVDMQRQIAAFLDDQVARIDDIISARTAQQATLAGIVLSVATELLGELVAAVPAPLAACVQIIDTEHKTAPAVDGDGYWIAGTAAVRDGEIVESALREIDHRVYTEWTQRARPHPGDLLMTREAPVGEVALLGSSGSRIAIGQRVVLLKPSSAVNSEYLRLVLMSQVLDRAVVETTQGSLHPHLNMSVIGRLRVPMIDLTVQEALGARFSSALQAIADSSAAYAKLIAALHELKRSLITAAVTGEFDVSTADGSQVRL